MDSISHVRGTTHPSLVDRTIGRALLLAESRWTTGPALISRHQNIRWNWNEFRAHVDAIATGLLSLGLVPGDRVGLWSPNCAEWLLTQFATARAGLIQVNINPAYRLAEVEYVLNKVGAKALICADRFKSTDYLGMIETLAPELKCSPPGALHSKRLPGLQSVIKLDDAARDGWRSFRELRTHTDAQRLDRVERTLKSSDPINIQFTSGTTGAPKGATLSHYNILNNACFVGDALGFGSADKLCIPVPLYHCFGMVMGNLACLLHGTTIVYPAASFDPVATLAAIEEEACTALYGVPTMFIQELAHPRFDEFDLSSLRTGLMGGSPCPIEVMRKVVDRMHMREVGIVYGMTEASPVIFQSSPADPLERRVSTVGRVQPHLEARVVDPLGNVVAVGEPGELCVRGYSVMIGYWDDPQQTRATIDADGWMHTGDRATLDAEGYCNIVGRIKDMIIRGGENIYPREIEDFLFRHPKIEMVQVVGVPDATYGEEVCAWLKLRSGQTATAEEITDFCRDRIAHYKIPRYVKFVDSFPMTVTGKIQKFEIRAAMIRELQLSEQRTA